MINISSNLGEYRKKINEHEEILSEIFDKIYPVGAIYLSTSSTSPSQLFGGDWIELPAGRVLLAQGTADSGIVYTAGSKGGEEKHILTTTETPAHTHTRGTMEIEGRFIIPKSLYNIDSMVTGAFSAALQDTSTVYGTTGTISDAKMAVSLTASKNWTGATSSVGGNASHNNMQPYLAVYMWQRVG